MQWALAFLVQYPEVQARIHQEIDEVIGESAHFVVCLGRVFCPTNAPCGTGYIRHVFQINVRMMPYPL